MRRTGDSERGSEGRLLGARPMPLRPAKPNGDSERRGVGKVGRARMPVGEGRLTLRRVGVGGGFEEDAELRFVARVRGTKIPEFGWAVVKYRTLRGC